MTRPSMRAVLIGGVAVVLLSGCTAPALERSTPATPAAESPTPATTVTVTATATPSATPVSSGGSAAGCTNGTTTIPAGSDTARIGDVDGDGRADTAFFTESGGPQYGIRTAAGGVYPVQDGLAGPATHSGWTAGLDASPGVVTVVDDGRSAHLLVFEDCAWVRTKGVDGKPYTFGLNGFFPAPAGTGVACNDRNGGVLLEGVRAVRRANGNVDIRWTQIDVSSDGRLARNGSTETRWTNLPPSDPRVAVANESRCGDAVKVHTSGE
jgi:hypothetical protein